MTSGSGVGLVVVEGAAVVLLDAGRRLAVGLVVVAGAVVLVGAGRRLGVLVVLCWSVLVGGCWCCVAP